MIWDENGLTLVLGDNLFRISQMAVMASLAAAAILLFLSFLYLRFLAPGKGKACRWRRARDHKIRPPFRKWRCKTCLVEAYSSDGRAPKECKRTLKAGL
ncbi:MAG: hypothetical protein IMF05_01325 [Proteobacteria bacterium]|nr:hypothetical protein [Pseudomonadota bacterium]